MRFIVAAAALVLSAPTFAAEQCLSVGQTALRTTGLPVVIVEAHCTQSGNWYIATDRPSVDGEKRYQQSELRVWDQPPHCLAEGDLAESPTGQIGEVTYAHCDLDGYEAYELTFDDGSKQRFDMTLEDNADTKLPTKIEDAAERWKDVNSLPD